MFEFLAFTRLETATKGSTDFTATILELLQRLSSVQVQAEYWETNTDQARLLPC